MNVSINCLALLGALALPLLAHGQVYKWVDQTGVVTYGNKPPQNAAGLTRLAEGDSRVSVIPAPRPQPARGTRGADLENRMARDPQVIPSGVDRATVAALGRELEWRERCFAERRVDCTAPTAATYDTTPSFSPFR